MRVLGFRMGGFRVEGLGLRVLGVLGVLGLGFRVSMYAGLAIKGLGAEKPPRRHEICWCTLFSSIM